MILVLVLDWVLVKRPHLPVDPRTLGGGLYYICDSQMTGEALSALGIRERTYSLGRMIGVSGKKRVGVDFAENGDLDHFGQV
jgi:hypothetical protein